MIEFKGITKQIGDKVILHDINLHIKDGELVVLIGPSGCGKTTTLRMINKLIKPTEGSIFINGNSIASEDTIQLRRQIGYVIQNVGLFPHMTIKENIELIPKLKKEPLEKINKIDGVVFWVVDLFAFEANLISRLNQKLPGKDIVMVLTKRDVLPTTLTDEKIINFVRNKFYTVCHLLQIE